MEQPNIARNLDEQLMIRQAWCTCKNPYWCNGEELHGAERGLETVAKYAVIIQNKVTKEKRKSYQRGENRQEVLKATEQALSNGNWVVLTVAKLGR